MKTQHNILNGSVTIIVTELGDVKLLSKEDFRDSINRGEHNTLIATVGEDTISDIEYANTKF